MVRNSGTGEMKGPSRKYLVALCLVTMMIARAAPGDVDAARDKLREAREAGKALKTLVETGITSAAQQQEATEHATAAQAALAEAARLFTEANAAASKDPAVLRDYAEVLTRRGDFDLAAEALQRAVDRKPGDAALQVKLGLACAGVGPAKRREALEVLRHAVTLELSPEDAARAWYALGDIYHREKLYAFARECYEKALTFEPSHVLARIGLAALDTREGKIPEAFKRMDEVGRAAQPHDAHVRVLLRDALMDFDARRRRFADTAENHAAYANLLYRAGRIPEAIMAANRAVHMRPEDFKTLNFIAAMQLQMGNLGEGMAAYEKSLKVHSEQPRIRRQLTELREYMKQQGHN